MFSRIRKDPEHDAEVIAHVRQTLNGAAPRHKTRVPQLASRIESVLKPYLPHLRDTALRQARNKVGADATKRAIKLIEELNQRLSTVRREFPMECLGDVFTTHTEAVRQHMMEDLDSKGVVEGFAFGLNPEAMQFALWGLHQKLWEIQQFNRGGGRPPEAMQASGLWKRLSIATEEAHRAASEACSASMRNRIVRAVFSELRRHYPDSPITKEPSEDSLRRYDVRRTRNRAAEKTFPAKPH